LSAGDALPFFSSSFSAFASAAADAAA